MLIIGNSDCYFPLNQTQKQLGVCLTESKIKTQLLFFSDPNFYFAWYPGKEISQITIVVHFFSLQYGLFHCFVLERLEEQQYCKHCNASIWCFAYYFRQVFLLFTSLECLVMASLLSSISKESSEETTHSFFFLTYKVFRSHSVFYVFLFPFLAPSIMRFQIS